MAKVTVSAKTYNFTNGTANDAAPVDSSFTTLFNNDDLLKTAVNYLEDGNFRETSTLTLNAAYAGVAPSTNGLLQVERGTLANSIIRWNETSDLWEASNDGTCFHTLLPSKRRSGFTPSYTSASQITLSSGEWTDSSGRFLINKTTSTTIDLTVSGAGGRSEAASEAADTWYYPYLIMKSSDGTVSAVLSTVNESISGSITLPSGYDIKAQLPFAVRNNGSSNILSFHIADGWPTRPKVMYYDFETSASFRVLNGGTATAAFTAGGGGTSVGSLSNFVPPISRVALIQAVTNNNVVCDYFLRPSDGQSTTGFNIASTNANYGSSFVQFLELPTSSSQGLVYRLSSGTGALSVYCYGFIVTENI